MKLSVADIHVRYGGTLALAGVSLEVATGEVVALIGANGAGKSTMLKAIMGLVPAEKARISLGDTPIGGRGTRERIAAGLSLSPEGRHVFPELSVAENLDLGYIGSDDSEKRQRRDEMCALFPRLKERENQAAGTLSGGEQQMLAIGRAMMAGPKILLLDEPTLGLAPIVVGGIVEFVRRISRAGVGILLSEQNAAVALGLAHRAYVLQNGALVIEGTAQSVAADPEIRKAYLGR